MEFGVFFCTFFWTVSAFVGRGGETRCRKKKKKKLSACRGEGSAVGLQLRVLFVPAALLAVPRTALALECVSKGPETGQAM
jgi:hypothetical protein